MKEVNKMTRKIGGAYKTTEQKINPVNKLINRNSKIMRMLTKQEEVNEEMLMKLVISNRNAVQRLKVLTHTRKKDLAM